MGTRMSSSRAIAGTSCAGGWPARPTPRLRPKAGDDLVAATLPRLAEMLACGTTTCEAKSGYGLDVESEQRMLRAIRTLVESQPMEIAATFMGAHEVPPEYRGRQAEYVRYVIDAMIPACRDLAEWCDVFCDRGFFTPEESEAILQAGSDAGLKPRIHADELASSGGSAVASAIRARSADHLVHATASDIAALAAGGVTATLLPAASLFLKLGRFAPARALIDAEVPVALATDVNPGGGLSPSMPFGMSLGCFAMGLSFEEALTAATLNGACALDRQDRVGSLEPGKQMDAVLVEGPAINLLRAGASPILAVFKRGVPVLGALDL
jgi:imidazolonepropionase